MVPPLLPVVQEILQSHSLVFRNPSHLPTHRCGAALDIILSTPTLLVPIAVHLHCCPLLASHHMLCSCNLNIPQASVSQLSHSPSLPRARDWSTVVATCQHSLSVWHQSILVHVPCPLASLHVHPLSLFRSLTQNLLDSASFRSRRHPTTRLPLWLKDACYHAFVARNGSWRGSVALGHKRFRLVSTSCASIFTAQFVPPGPAFGTCGMVLSLSRRAPRLACSLIRRNFLFLVVTPTCGTCNGMAPPALPSLLVRRDSNGAPMFPLTGDSVLSDDFFHTLSPLRVSHILARVRQTRCPLLLQRTRCCALQVPRISAGCGLPLVFTLQGVFPMVASSSAFLPFHLEVQLCFSGHQARW